MKELPIGKWGEGTGTPMSTCIDPNSPSFDPATHFDNTEKTLLWLVNNAWKLMNKWERDFCQSVYGVKPLSRKQHIMIGKLHRRYK